MSLALSLLVCSLGASLASFYFLLASRISYYCYGEGYKKIRHIFKRNGSKKQLSFLVFLLLRPSHCLSCETRLSPLQLIPLLSYWLARGKCKFCKTPFAIHHFFAEFYLALLALLYFAPTIFQGIEMRPEQLFLGITTLFFCGHLYISIATDIKIFILDYENSICLLFWALVALFLDYHLNGWDGVQLKLISASLIFLIFFLLSLFSKFKGLGLGDVILVGILALFIGIPWILGIIQLAALGSIIHILLYKKDRKAAAPLGAYLCLSFLFCIAVEKFITLL